MAAQTLYHPNKYKPRHKATKPEYTHGLRLWGSNPYHNHSHSRRTRKRQKSGKSSNYQHPVDRELAPA